MAVSLEIRGDLDTFGITRSYDTFRVKGEAGSVLLSETFVVLCASLVGLVCGGKMPLQSYNNTICCMRTFKVKHFLIYTVN